MRCSLKCTVLALSILSVWLCVVVCFLLNVTAADRVITDVKNDGNEKLEECASKGSEAADSFTRVVVASSKLSIQIQVQHAGRTAASLLESFTNLSSTTSLSSLSGEIASHNNAQLNSSYLIAGRVVFSASALQDWETADLEEFSNGSQYTPVWGDLHGGNEDLWNVATITQLDATERFFQPLFRRGADTGANTMCLAWGAVVVSPTARSFYYAAFSLQGLLDFELQNAIQSSLFKTPHDRLFILTETCGADDASDESSLGCTVARKGLYINSNTVESTHNHSDYAVSTTAARLVERNYTRTSLFSGLKDVAIVWGGDMIFIESIKVNGGEYVLVYSLQSEVAATSTVDEPEEYVNLLIIYVVATTVGVGGVFLVLLILLTLRPLDKLIQQFERAAGLSNFESVEDVLQIDSRGVQDTSDAYRVGGIQLGSEDELGHTHTSLARPNVKGAQVFLTNHMTELAELKQSIYTLLLTIKDYKQYMPQAVIERVSEASEGVPSEGDFHGYETDESEEIDAKNIDAESACSEDALSKDPSSSTLGGMVVTASTTSADTAGHVSSSARPVSPGNTGLQVRESFRFDSNERREVHGSGGAGAIETQLSMEPGFDGELKVGTLREKSPKQHPAAAPLKKLKNPSSISLHRKKGVTQVSLGMRDFDEFARRVVDPTIQSDTHSMFLQACVADAKDYSGVVERFVADSIDVNFGGLQSCTRGSVKATHYALRVRDRISTLPAFFDSYDTEPAIGISSGVALVGNLGCTFIKAPCVLGRTVYNSKAMQAISREIGLDIIMDTRHTEELGGTFKCLPADIIRLTETGRKQAVYFLVGVSHAKEAVEWLYSIQEGRESTYEKTWAQLKTVGEKGSISLMSLIEQLSNITEEPIARNVVARLRQYSDEILTMTGKPAGEYCRIYRNRQATLPQPEFLRRVPTHRVRSQLHGSAAVVRSSSAGQSQGTGGTSGEQKSHPSSTSHNSNHSAQANPGNPTSSQTGSNPAPHATPPLVTEGSLGTLHSSMNTLKSSQPTSSPAAFSSVSHNTFGRYDSVPQMRATRGDASPQMAGQIGEVARKGSMAVLSSAAPVPRVSSEVHTTPDLNNALDESFDLAASLEEMRPSEP